MLTVDYDRIGLHGGERVLDLGCGAGRHAFASLRHGAQVVALDTSFDELAGVRAMFGVMSEAGEVPASSGASGAVQADAGSLPFPDGAFDCIIASEVLEHVPDDRRAMTELARVLKPGGVLAVTVPRFGPELVNWALSDAYHNVPGGHVRIYRRSTLLRRISGTGLRQRGAHHAHALHSPYWWLRCLVGPQRDSHPLVAAYHKLLVWDIVSAPWPTRTAERLLNPLIGKSYVAYFEKVA
ncbi:MAG: class I SAM-dependent methyltransferase [Actinomycetota bacterium]|nr:class I SAM-dependent methyltransferase [Actinomycetota bacterium]